ncbi:MAG: hypothetical protein LBK53_01495 [Heliobacteriaceae bacterium]|jgi:hypothetical protein|nr:hypothetical protein [Heliobacteriaceae bacterium]
MLNLSWIIGSSQKRGFAHYGRFTPAEIRCFSICLLYGEVKLTEIVYFIGGQILKQVQDDVAIMV